jgi:hypothetical protein
MGDFSLVTLSLIDACPEYREALARQTAIAQQLADVKRHLAPVAESVRNGGTPPVPASTASAAVDRPGARSILRSVGIAAPEPISSRETAYTRLNHEARDLEEALEVAGQEADRARFSASATVCDAVRPEFRRRAHAVGLALIELGHAVEAHLELEDALIRERVYWSQLGPFGARQYVGRPRDPNSNLWIWLRELVRLGHLAQADIPPEWRRGR